MLLWHMLETLHIFAGMISVVTVLEISGTDRKQAK